MIEMRVENKEYKKMQDYVKVLPDQERVEQLEKDVFLGISNFKNDNRI